MQSNDLFHIENIDTLCCYNFIIRRYMYDIKILWLIGFIFELSIGLVFQYIQLQLRSWCTKYICILNVVFTTHVQKKFTFQHTSHSAKNKKNKKILACSKKKLLLAKNWDHSIKKQNKLKIVKMKDEVKRIGKER